MKNIREDVNVTHKLTTNLRTSDVKGKTRDEKREMRDEKWKMFDG